MPNLNDILTPPEAWDAAEQEIDFWIEEKDRQEYLKWKKLNSF